jgi:CBS domain-containing protein
MQFPSEWEEAYLDERSFRVAILQEPLSSLEVRAPICVSPETRAGDAIRLMNEQRIGALLVTDGDDRLIGIFTERDVLKKLVGASPAALDRPVREVMTPEPCCLHRDDAVVFALKLMHEGGFRHVPLVDDDDHPYSVISVKDVVEFVVHLFAREMMTAPPTSKDLTPTSPEGA